MIVAVAPFRRWAFFPISPKFRVQTPWAPRLTKRKKMPVRKPKSPTRLTMKAFLPASEAESFSYQNPIRQVGAEAHPFPAHEHHEKVVPRDQQEHHEDEEVQVDEEPLETRVVVHVAHGVDVDEKTHARDDQAHDDGKGVDLETDGDIQLTRGDPGVEVPFEYPRRRRELKKLGKDDGRGEE